MLTRPLMLLSPPINRGRFHAREVGEKKPKKNYPNTSLSLKKEKEKKNRNHPILLEAKKTNKTSPPPTQLPYILVKPKRNTLVYQSHLCIVNNNPSIAVPTLPKQAPS